MNVPRTLLRKVRVLCSTIKVAKLPVQRPDVQNGGSTRTYIGMRIQDPAYPYSKGKTFPPLAAEEPWSKAQRKGKRSRHEGSARIYTDIIESQNNS